MWPEVHAPEPAATARSVQAALDGIAEVVAALRRMPTSREPAFYDAPELADAILAKYRGTGFGGALRHTLAIGVVARASISPARLADLLVDPDAQREALGARRVEPLGPAIALGPRRTMRSFHVEKADVGAGPLRTDLEFQVTVERWDAPDGSVFIRYDPRPAGRVRHVTYWRGLALVEPHPTGARVTEVLVTGTDLLVPSPLDLLLRRLTRETLKNARRELLGRAR